MDYLTDVAIDSIWCTPDQDYQAIIEPKRITPSYGTRRSFKQIYDYVKTPNNEDVFHVFHVGQLNPNLLGLFSLAKQWRKLSTNMVEMNMIVNVYNEYGIQLNRDRCYYIVTSNNNLLLAITEPNRVPVNPGTEKIYFRVYSNAYFNSLRKTDAQLITYGGGAIQTREDIINIQNRLETLKSPISLYTHCFINGFKVETINLLNTTIGDEVEFIQDLSIKRVWNYRVKSLRRYTSHMDQLAKYLITYFKPNQDEEIIEFHDDADIYITDTVSDYKGVYVHRNDARTLRMVNHRDYGLSIKTVEAIAHGNNWNTSEDVRAQLFIRHSGYHRPLVHESNRIHELFKLTHTQRVNAMVGTEALVPEWRAENLEASHYTKVMRNKDFDFDKVTIDKCFGYYATTSITSNTPTKTRLINGVNGVKVPVNLQKRSTSYEYDSKGKLLNSNPVYEAYDYYTEDKDTKLVEFIKGIGSDFIDDRIGLQKSDYDPRYDYRFYTCDIIDGVIKYNWKDVTDSDLYAFNVATKELQWFTNPNDTYTLVRDNSTFLSYPLEITPNNGVIRFRLRNRVFINEVMVTQEMRIPMDHLDIYLNGHSLIEGIDYFVDFPEVVITNKSFLNQPFNSKQDIFIRYHGLADSTLKHKNHSELGFVSHELLSKNKQFNLRDDKVLRIVANGATYHRDDLKFSETSPGSMLLNSLNGKPYQIKDLIVPIREVSSFRTDDLLKEAKILDTKISDYLTPRIPEPDVNYPNVIEDKYPLVSPFISNVLNDLLKGYLDVVFLYDQHSDEKVKEFLKDYEYLLEFDPTQLDIRPNMKYVEIHPHAFNYVVEIPIHKYRFLQRAVDVYCNGMIKLSHFLKLDTF